jgi:excisionase family DNA binding protein
MQSEELMIVDEVAAMMRLHKDSIRRQLRRGELPGVRIGKRWWVYRADLEARLRGGESRLLRVEAR